MDPVMVIKWDHTPCFSSSIALPTMCVHYIKLAGSNFRKETLLLCFSNVCLSLLAPQEKMQLVPLYWREENKLSNYLFSSAAGWFRIKLLPEYLRQRTAGPVSTLRPAAGGLSGTRRRLVTPAIVSRQWEGGHFAEPRHNGASCPMVTCGGSQVADGAVGTAVQMVITTHCLQEKEAL